MWSDVGWPLTLQREGTFWLTGNRTEEPYFPSGEVGLPSTLEADDLRRIGSGIVTEPGVGYLAHDLPEDRGFIPPCLESQARDEHLQAVDDQGGRLAFVGKPVVVIMIILMC